MFGFFISNDSRIIFVLKDNSSNRSSNNIFNNKIEGETEKEKEMLKTYDNIDNINANTIDNKTIDDISNIKEQNIQKNEESIKINKSEINSNNKH